MIIDGHAHLYAEDNYAEHLLRQYDKLGIDTVCVSGLGDIFALADNDDVEKAFKAHPDRIVGFAFFRLGHDNPSLIERFHDRGFKGIKVTCPTNHYDADEFLPVYAKAEELHMPVLFHLGIVTTAPGRRDDVTSRWMRPMHLDRLAHLFPGLPLIGAHMGVPWYEEMAELPRFHKNVYIDITGKLTGWRAHLKARDIKRLLWYPGAIEHLIFGTDVHYTEAKQALDQDVKLYRTLRLKKKVRDGIFAGTMARLIGLNIG
ncbi:MAG: amidohydrolase family protein [Planctomycetota bacterium]